MTELEDQRSTTHASCCRHGVMPMRLLSPMAPRPTTRRVPQLVMRDGLDPAFCKPKNCKHICLALTPGLAAHLIEGGTVIAVDTSGLDLFFECGEARHHGSVISSQRLTVLEKLLLPTTAGWSSFSRTVSLCELITDP